MRRSRIVTRQADRCRANRQDDRTLVVPKMFQDLAADVHGSGCDDVPGLLRQETEEVVMKLKVWKIIFCGICEEPTVPANGILTDHMGFVCDECLNTELEEINVKFAPASGDETCNTTKNGA